MLRWSTGALQQWCTGSGFWSPIRPDIKNLLDLDWISFSLHPDPEPDYPNEKTVAMQKTCCGITAVSRKITIF